MKLNKNILSAIFLLLLISNTSLSRSDSTFVNENRLLLNPRFFGVQIEGTSFLVVSELGGLVDFDIYNSTNKLYSFGTRISVENYSYLRISFGGNSGEDFPYIDYNLYAKHSIRGRMFWFSFLGGISLHTKQGGSYSSDVLFPRAGFELKYNLSKYAIGILLKGATSFKQETGYLGIGLSLGYYDY